MTTPAISEHTDRLQDEAIEWLIRLSAENCPETDTQAFNNWLHQSPAHQAAYAEITQRMNWLERVAKTDTDTRNAALGYRPRGKKHTLQRTIKLATAASILLVAGIATFSSQGWYGNTRHYQVAQGEHKTIHLADGSQLELNTDSEIKVRYNHFQRSIEIIKGEVFFSVQHNAQRPFIVTAGAGRSIDIGTEFNIHRQADKVVIAVQQGSVRVEAQQSRDLITSQAIAYNQNGEFINLPSSNIDSLTAWRHGKLIFNNCRLDEVLTEISRYHKVQLSLGNPKLGDKKVSGTFFINHLFINLMPLTLR